MSQRNYNNFEGVYLGTQEYETEDPEKGTTEEHKLTRAVVSLGGRLMLISVPARDLNLEDINEVSNGYRLFRWEPPEQISVDEKTLKRPLDREFKPY